MLLLKADTKYDKKLRTAIGKLEGEQKKKFDEEVEKRMEAWTRDYIAGKTSPFMTEILSGELFTYPEGPDGKPQYNPDKSSMRIPPKYEKRFERIVKKIQEELDKGYPGISKLTEKKDDLFDDGFDVADLSIGDITIDFDDVINRNQLNKLWVEKTKGADKKFPDVKTADYDYLVDEVESETTGSSKPMRKPRMQFKKSISGLAYKSKYSKEALKAPKKEKGESTEDFETRKKQHQALKEEYEKDKSLWEEYTSYFGNKYPQYVENLIEKPDKKRDDYSIVVFQDFEEKLSEILKDVKAYDAKKVKSQYQSKKLAEMLAKNESMRKLLEEIRQEKLVPPQDKIDAKRKRVEKAVYLGLSGTTLPTGGEEYSGEGKDRVFEGAFDVIGRWIKDSNLRKEFLDARSKNQSEVKLEDQVEEYNDLVNTLFDAKRATHLRRRGIEPEERFGSEAGAKTEIKKYLRKEFGVKGVEIKQSGRDIIVQFLDTTKSRQQDIQDVKSALNTKARVASLYGKRRDEGGKSESPLINKLRRQAVAEYEKISPKLKDALKKLLYKGKVARDAIDLSELFITKDSEWNGTSWDNPVVREDADGMEATEMMIELMESAGEDRMKPPRKVKEIDVARRKGRFAQELSGRKQDARTLDIDDILERHGRERPNKKSALRGLSLEEMEKVRSGLKSTTIETLVKNKPRYDTLRKTLVFLEDEIEDNVKLLDGRKKVKGARELIEVQLQGVANVVAYFQVSSKDQMGRKKYAEMKKMTEQLKTLKTNFSMDLQMPRAMTTTAQNQQDRKVKGLTKKYARDAQRIAENFKEALDGIESVPIGEQKGKSPFRGSLKQALLSHATKVDFDLDDAIDESQRMVEQEYEALEEDDTETIIGEYGDAMNKLMEMVENPDDYIEARDEAKDEPRLRRRKKGTEQSARTIAQEKKKLVAQLREKNPKMSLAQIEDMATQQLQSEKKKLVEQLRERREG